MTAVPTGRTDALGSGWALDDDRWLVPEPVVKSLLHEVGVKVPRGAVLGESDIRQLQPPLVVKAFGPGIVHKTEVGGVRLDVDLGSVDVVVDTMTAALARRSLRPGGFLIEEQHKPALELLLGAVDTPLGVMVMLALGGVLAEALDTTVMAPWPLAARDIEGLLDRFPAPGLFTGGRAPVSRAALVELISRFSTLVERIGDRLAELECNPVAVSPDGAIALDARLLLLRRPASSSVERAPTDFSALFAPGSVAVAGASTERQTFGNRFLAAYRDAGWDGALFAIHPSADRIDGVPAFPALCDVPGGAVDYLVVAVPAARCPELVSTNAERARFIHVISGGFAEAGADGEALQADLVAAIGGSSARLLGPNCMGVFAPDGRQTFLLGSPRAGGTVGVVSQSGALAGDIVKGGDARGIRFSKLVTVGNAVDVTAAELLEHLVHDPATSVIGVYLEGSADGRRLVAALREAAGKKPVVVLAAGSTRQGAAAVQSHTGALAAEQRLWSAVAATTGATMVDTLEDLLAVLAFAQRYARSPAPVTSSVLVIGPGGGAAVLATDACDRHGLGLLPVDDDSQARLRQQGYGAGTSIRNPIEIPAGPATSPDIYDAVLRTVLDRQACSDLLLHINVQSYYSYGTGGVDPLLVAVRRLTRPYDGTRSALVLRNLDCAPGAERDRILATVDEAGQPFFRTFDEAAVAIAGMQRFDAQRAATRSSRAS